MARKSIAPPRVRFVTNAILTVGITSAMLIYWVNIAPAPDSGSALEDSKKNVLEMEKFGGQGNVLAIEFSEWFDGLWRGKSLAYTVAVLTVLLALVYRYIATLPTGTGESKGERTSGHG